MLSHLTRFGAAAVLLPALAWPGLAGPSHLHLLPSTTKEYLSAPDARKLTEPWDKTAFARLLKDYVSKRETLAGVAWLLDLRHDPSVDDIAMSRLLAERGIPLLAILTKADKVRRGQRRAHAESILSQIGLVEDQSIMTSVATREGIPELRRSITALATLWAKAGALREEK